MIPAKKPQRGFDWISQILPQVKLKKTDKILLIGFRGYFLNSMGVLEKNDRGIYDDALDWVELETGIVHQFNGNVDPSAYRKGKGTGSSKGMASLKNGTWRYKIGMHNGSVPHMAYRQAADVTVIRDGNPNYEETGQFGINIHRGGRTGTSSLGCQTVPPSQWDDFNATGTRLLKAAKQQNDFPYHLCEMQG
jgi:lysozyme